MTLFAPAAPKQRRGDDWRAYIPGMIIVGVSIALHELWKASVFGNDHLLVLMVGYGCKRLPQGRVWDGWSWRSVLQSRSREFEVPPVVGERRTVPRREDA